MYYKINLSNKANKDINRITEYLQGFANSVDKIIKKINKDIDNLLFMPRIHKTLIYFKDKKGEYRRIVSGKYIIIYKITNNEITILRIFNQKENYLNQRNFILKEDTQKYLRTKRRSCSLFSPI